MPPKYIGIKPSEYMETTYEENNSKDKISKKIMVLKGLSGLRKKVVGKVQIGIPDSINDKRILVIPYTRCGDIFPILDKVIGVIVEQGSPFEHLGIILRELNIPCIYNVSEACTLLHQGEEIELDGLKGEVIYKKVN